MVRGAEGQLLDGETPLILDAAGVRAGLTIAAAIPVVRRAMIALSSGEVRQLLRSFIGLSEGRTFAIMPAAMGEGVGFGAKLVSVFQSDAGKKHEGVVVLFDPDSGAPICVADAGEITRIRTAAASAVATDALARPEAEVLAILGTGAQALAHAQAIRLVRPISEVRVWGRDEPRAAALADQVGGRACTLDQALAGADIVCTVTGAVEPILPGAGVAPGTHVNLVGSSGPGQAEADADLVANSRFIVDHREHVLAHGGEFLRAKAAGVLGDDHIAGEIGEVLAGSVQGRQSADQITVYKSLGHAVQDLACAAFLYHQALRPA